MAQFQIDLMFFSGCAIAYMSGWEIDLASALMESGVEVCLCILV